MVANLEATPLDKVYCLSNRLFTFSSLGGCMVVILVTTQHRYSGLQWLKFILVNFYII